MRQLRLYTFLSLFGLGIAVPLPPAFGDPGPELISAVASAEGNAITVTFSEPLADGSVAAENFSLDGGVSVLGATLAPNQRAVLLATTSQRLPGTALPEVRPAYVMATFHNNRQRLQIGISADGQVWRMLTNAAGADDIYAPPGGDDLRDPSIARIGDAWYCAYTSGDYGSAHVPPTSGHFGNGETYFGLAKSTDLIHWTWLANVPIAATTQVWGPRLFVTAAGAIYCVVSVNSTLKYLTPTDATLTIWTPATPIPGLPTDSSGYPIGPEIFLSEARGAFYLTSVYQHVPGEGNFVTFLKSTTSPIAGYTVLNTTNVTGLPTNQVEGAAPIHLGGPHWRLYYCAIEIVNGTYERPARFEESHDDLATWSGSTLLTHDAAGDVITHPHVLSFLPLTLTVRGLRGATPSAPPLYGSASINLSPSPGALAFRGFAVTAGQNTTLTLPRPSLLAQAAGGALELLDASPVSQRGGTVALSANGLTYSPAPGFLGADQFTATLGDGHGGRVTATIDVKVITSSVTDPPVASLTRRSGGAVEVLFRGLPRSLYFIERSPDLLDWTLLQTLPAGDDSLLPFLDLNPPATQAFYRTRLP